MADNPQTKTEKLIKYGNKKFGLNETTLRGILDNASAGTETPLSELLYTLDLLSIATLGNPQPMLEDYTNIAEECSTILVHCTEPYYEEEIL